MFARNNGPQLIAIRKVSNVRLQLRYISHSSEPLRSSHRVRRTVDDVVTAPDVEPSTNASLSGHVGSSKRCILNVQCYWNVIGNYTVCVVFVFVCRSLENEFLQGSRARSEPCCVRRTDMVVGGRGRKVNLSYMETLASDTPPSLSSLPTPAQVCRPRRYITHSYCGQM